MQFRKPTVAAAVLSLLALAWQARGWQQAPTAPSSHNQQAPEASQSPGTSQTTVSVGPADPAKGTASAPDNGKNNDSIRVQR